MIDPTILNSYPATNTAETPARPHLHMRRDPDDRTAGSMPVWEGPVTNNAGQPKSGDFKTAMNYANVEPGAGIETDAGTSEEFSFGDLVDIINPLHHIPLVSVIYESVTGDTIKPSGRIIGGAVFGGFAGAAAGIANVIVEEETGKDMAGNVFALVTQGEVPQAKRAALTPEENLDQAARQAFNEIQTEPLPPMALGIQPVMTRIEEQTSVPRPSYQNEYQSYREEDDRMAGSRMRPLSRINETNSLPRMALANPVSINLAAIRTEQMQAVTQLELTPLPRE